MMWRNWNKADKTLLAAGVIFLFALCLHIQYPKSMFADGFLFCAEAALVGGIAAGISLAYCYIAPSAAGIYRSYRANVAKGIFFKEKIIEKSQIY